MYLFLLLNGYLIAYAIILATIGAVFANWYAKAETEDDHTYGPICLIAVALLSLAAEKGWLHHAIPYGVFAYMLSFAIGYALLKIGESIPEETLSKADEFYLGYRSHPEHKGLPAGLAGTSSNYTPEEMAKHKERAIKGTPTK